MSKRLLTLFLLTGVSLFAQEPKTSMFLDANYFYGSILRHNKDISHLITDHPQGVIFGLNYKTFGSKRWHQEYNYPDWGVSFAHQNSGNETLGNNYGIYGHFNFYFLKRKLMFRVAQGIAYASNPFDLDTNFKNNAYGTRFLSSTYILLNYNKPNLFKNIGIQGGIALVHYSNGNFKAPNSSTNAFTFNLGVQYSLDSEGNQEYLKDESPAVFSKKIRYNFVLRGGLNESDFVGLGQHPFFVVSAFASKRITYKSTLQVGAEAFFARFLKEEIKFVSVAFLNSNVQGDEDYKRVGVFVGHELNFNRFAVVSQFGYYVYYPYDFEGRTYIRAGAKYYFSDKLFGVTTLKSHGAKVEGVEFGVGVRI